MKYYRVTGKVTIIHKCNCQRCTEKGRQLAEVSVIARTGPDVDDDYIQAAGLRVAFRELGLVDETDGISWDNSQEVLIREAYQDEVMIALGAPRLPGFEEG